MIYRVPNTFSSAVVAELESKEVGLFFGVIPPERPALVQFSVGRNAVAVAVLAAPLI